jgi:hypothetical protein
VLYLKLDSESGMVMAVVLIVALIGSILAGSYMTVVISESRNSVWQKQRSQSFFLAEAGIEKGLYYLNNPHDIDNPWTDEYGEMLDDIPMVSEDLAEGRYEVSLLDQMDEPWLPANSYLIRSAGIIPQNNSDDIEHHLSCIAARLDGVPIPAALGIMDDADIEDELLKFDSSSWTISGRDASGPGGLPGIAVANDGDDLPGQLKPARLDQVTGYDEDTGMPTEGTDAIIEDPSLPKNLNAYVEYFKRMAIDISGSGTIPDSALGASDDYEIVYCDLSYGNLQIAAGTQGYGVLVLEGNGEFEMAGGSEWYGIIICAGDSYISLKGGGGGVHIYGSLLIANGTVEMNGTADLIFSSSCLTAVNSQLVLYQVYSWCGGWGESL